MFVSSHTEIHLIDMTHQKDVSGNTSGKANGFITLCVHAGLFFFVFGSVADNTSEYMIY